MIIAIKEKERVVIGYSLTDSWDSLSEKDYVDEENIAIEFSDTGKVFALSDMNRRADILLYDDDFLNMEITPKNIVKELIPYIKKKLKENGKPIREDGRWKNALVICDNEHIYDIDPKFGFYEADDYACHGYKVETLKSVLDETKNLPAEERMIKAVSFASRLHRESLFPLIITDTKTKRFKHIYEGENENEHFDSI